MSKRFSLYYNGRTLDKDNDKWLDPHEVVALADELNDEIIMLKEKLDNVLEDNMELIKENDKLRCEINMLRIKSARDEVYIKRLTCKTDWRT
ncbi:MAG: hypothetical protein IJJ47_10210 [Methanosphaera sp.]|nr:hypothetical protein [Methanosphaera sp.]